MADFWYAENVEKLNRSSYCHKIWQEASSINTMNCAENRHYRPKNGRLTAFLYLENAKIEPINIFSPSFRQKFL